MSRPIGPDDVQPYVCPHAGCGAVSYNPNDRKHQYCGRCRRHASEPAAAGNVVVDETGHPTVDHKRPAGPAEFRAAQHLDCPRCGASLAIETGAFVFHLVSGCTLMPCSVCGDPEAVRWSPFRRVWLCQVHYKERIARSQRAYRWLFTAFNTLAAAWFVLFLTGDAAHGDWAQVVLDAGLIAVASWNAHRAFVEKPPFPMSAIHWLTNRRGGGGG